MYDGSLNSPLDFWQLREGVSGAILNPDMLQRRIVVNRDRLLRSNQICELILDEKIRPLWLSRGDRIRLYFPNIYGNSMKGEILAYFLIDDNLFPAISIDGDKIVFNFHLDETINHILLEKYLSNSSRSIAEGRSGFSRPIYTYLPMHYHLIPGGIRFAIFKSLTSVKKLRLKKDLKGANFLEKDYFPSWPVEDCIEGMRWAFLKTLHLLVSSELTPTPFWPDGKQYAVVLVHDVDTKHGFERIHKLLDVDDRFNVVSCWSIVARHYNMDKSLLRSLIQRGHEIAMHGYNHDGKLSFLRLSEINKRLSECSDFISDFQVRGFRSPSLLRTENLFHALKGFSYDNSVPDTEILSQNAKFSGCCTIFPFWKQNLLELPVTVPMDCTLLFLGYSLEEILKVWLDKIKWIKSVGGLAVITTHPEPHFSGNNAMVDVYAALLKEISSDETAWITTPSKVAESWKSRNIALGGRV